MQITDKITTIKGIGPKKASALERLKIRTLGDLLFYYPREYQDRRQIQTIKSLKDGDTASIRARIVLLVPGGFRGKRTLQVLVTDDTGELSVVFFKADYLIKQLEKNQEYELYGKVTERAGRLQMVHPEIERKSGLTEQGKILPLYPLTEGISQKDLRKWIKESFSLVKELPELLPEAMRLRNRLCSLSYAIENIHFPEDPQKMREAKFRLVFDEFLELQLGLLSMKERVFGAAEGISFSKTKKMCEFTQTLPFSLTGAQARVLAEVETDMESKRIMNRLIQGDVGSGKTALAAAAAYKAIKSGFQAVMMAPTEILAGQHYETLTSLFSPLGVKVGCLTGSLAAKEKKALLLDIQEKRIDFLVGTHALIQPQVTFKKLGLVITDEQHRFGVRQRSLLQQKGNNPDVLVMTATPIPRTLAVILYADLDISVVDELPPGRKPVITKAVTSSKREDAYTFVREEIAKGRQAYVVAPLIEESTEIEAKSAKQLFEELSGHFPGVRVCLLHGTMKQTEKDHVMELFAKGQADILVSTVVIEVGINVPNASIMVIENAERFGLASLHQLRGRVGRGAEQSYCFLVTEGKTEQSKERIKILCETNDGFLIAEKDLLLRGPGEFFGFRQHGLPELKLADPSKHLSILEIARKEAFFVLETDPDLENEENAELKNRMQMLFEDVEGLSI
ncbi:MAG: ATP-dependent DNA helicase RecG [Eubacteriales bacterium]|nr:ATP-dependent DNA helicase RecG [Eubacteriales bacterium]MDD3349879.1 ATP-dependent DNA helicase RecG [Eubacteriales bacterium]